MDIIFLLFRTLEYLSRHLYRVSLRGHETGMTAKNVAIVWAPNLLRSKSLEVGGVAALQGVGVQAVVTEYLIRYCELIFSEKVQNSGVAAITTAVVIISRPKSLAISTPTKLLSLEEARNRTLSGAGAGAPEQRYIEVGGGPNNLPPTYHTVIDLPGCHPRKAAYERSSTRQRKSPVGWKTIFAPGKMKYKSNNKISDSELFQNNLEDESSSNGTNSDGGHRLISATTSLAADPTPSSGLRPVRSAESLTLPSPSQDDNGDSPKGNDPSSSRPNSGEVKDEIVPLETVTLALLKSSASSSSRESPKTHSRSSSHDSYFESRTPFKPSDSSVESPIDPNSLDLSEIQVNFELEENEMKIFCEDEEDALMSTSFTSIDEDDVRPSFRRISRHNSSSRKSEQSGGSFRKLGSHEASPKKKKSDFTPGTSPNSNLVKRSKMETDESNEKYCLPSPLPISPSIKFIDDRPPSPCEE
ncbi:Uncharacterized protein FKW44_015869, partial [Caligus rogercresseyi]